MTSQFKILIFFMALFQLALPQVGNAEYLAITKFELAKEFQDYKSTYKAHSGVLSEIELKLEEQTLRSDPNYANVKMQLRDIARLLRDYEAVDIAKRDLLLVDIGFAINRSEENLRRLLDSVEED